MGTLGLGRVGFQDIVKTDLENGENQWKDVVKVITTKQEFDRFKLISDFDFPVITEEGSVVNFDARVSLYTKDFYPKNRTLAFGVTMQAAYTDQYNVLSGYSSDIAQTFLDGKNQVVANLWNNAFDTSYLGIDGVVLCHTAHPYQAYPTWSNRPSPDLAFGNSALETALAQLRKQKTARQKPISYSGKVNLYVPADLEFAAMRVVNSAQVAGTANNDMNAIKPRIQIHVLDYLTSATAWFLRMADPNKHELFLLQRKPFYVKNDEDVRTLTNIHVCGEEYVTGWKKANGTWGTTGA
jgi:hypothetical protein